MATWIEKDGRTEAGTEGAQESFSSTPLPRPQNLFPHKEGYRIAVAQISTDPGAIARNTEKIIDYIARARRAGASTIVFPELTIPGYLAMDLFKREQFLIENIAALKRIREASLGMTVVVGFANFDPGRQGPDGKPVVYNSAAIIHDGEIIRVQDKTLLPEYDIFFEQRYFTSASEREVALADGVKLGAEICEDLWTKGYDQDPSRELAEKGADLLINLSASPFHLNKFNRRFDLVSSTAKTSGLPFLYANLVGSFDGHEGEVVFDGRSMVVGPDGELLAVAPGFKEGLLLVDLTRAAPIALPAIVEVEELHDALVLGIRDYFRRLGSDAAGEFKRAIIGISGGIDSAVVAALATEALGAEKVFGITMPSRYNSPETIADAAQVAANLGISFRTSPIGSTVEAELEQFRADPEIAALPEDVTEENIQARTRMMRLMAYANKLHGIVLNTGNRTEVALNNCTIYGDMVGGFSVLGDIDKDRIFALARYINTRAGREIIPQTTIDRVPSAELKPNQSDATVMGDDPARIAPLVRAIIENDLCVSEAIAQWSDTYPEALIRSAFHKLDASEWKRRQGAPAIRVTPHTFGDGRRIPMGHGYQG